MRTDLRRRIDTLERRVEGTRLQTTRTQELTAIVTAMVAATYPLRPARGSEAVTLPQRWSQLRQHEQQTQLGRIRDARTAGRPYPRFAYVVAGRRSGKSEIAKRELVLAATERKPWPDARYFYGAPTRDQAKRIAWKDLKRLVPKGWVSRILESELVIELAWGAEIHVVGLDRPERIEGTPWDGGVLDESCDLKPGTFAATIYPALADRDGWCWRMGVPKRDGPSSREFRKDCERAREASDCVCLHWESETVLSPEFIAKAKATLDPKTYREQFQATWETDGNSVYEFFSTEYNVRPCPYRNDRPIVVTCDFNVDYMAWLLCHRLRGPAGDYVEVFDELWQSAKTTQGMLTVLWDRYGTHGAGFEFYGDAASRQRHTSASQSDYQTILIDPRFRRAGRTVHFPRDNPPVKDRVASCNAMFENAGSHRRLFVDPRCVALINDLEQVSWKTGGTELNKQGDLTHPTDALGYYIHYAFPLVDSMPDDENDDESRFGVSVA